MKLLALAPRRAVNSVSARPQNGRILLGRRARQPVTCFGLRHILIPNGDGDSAHLDFTFEDKTVTVIELGEGSYEVGREAETSEICLPIPTVSGRHALIRLADDSLTLTDLGSTNGTYVNGKELERNVETVVKTSDVIVFGDGHLASFIYDASEE